MDNITYLGILLPRFFMELVAAILSGVLLGMERGKGKRSEGLRETILVCFGAVLFMIVGELIDLGGGESHPSDPGRLAGWIIGAAGLLAAASAIRRKPDAATISTATRIWVTAGVGLIIGAGYPILGLLITAIIIFTLTLLRGLDAHMAGHGRPLLLKLVAREDTPELRRNIQAVLEKSGVRPDSLRAEAAPMGVKLTVTAAAEPSDIRPLLAALWTVPGVTEVEH
jgi:putative Mg2+ transporter-C (MgtC) family protein